MALPPDTKDETQSTETGPCAPTRGGRHDSRPPLTWQTGSGGQVPGIFTPGRAGCCPSSSWMKQRAEASMAWTLPHLWELVLALCCTPATQQQPLTGTVGML